MKNHTTHFDDCGCLRERLEGEIEKLKSKLERLEGVLRGIADSSGGYISSFAAKKFAKLASEYFKGKGE